MAKKKVLILEDRYPQRDREINLGDRALYTGVHELLEHGVQKPILMGKVKSFPYFTLKKFGKNPSEKEIEKIFDNWCETIENHSPHRARMEKKMIRFLETSILTNNIFFQNIEKKFQEKYSRGIVETIKPYIFRHYYSQNIIEKIKKADIVIFNGGGLISDHLKYYAPMPLFELYLAKNLGKKVGIVNQTASLFDPLLFKVASVPYKKLDFVNVREKCSDKMVEKLGVSKKRVTASCDAAFTAIPASDKKIKKIISHEDIRKDDVVLIIRGDKKVNYQLWAEIVRYLNTKDKRVLFLHTCKAHDKKVITKLSKLGEIREISTYYNYQEVIGLLRHVSLVITDRYHGAIFSIIAHTPVIPFDPTTFKMRGLFKMTTYPIKVMGRAENKRNVFVAIDLALKNGKGLSKNLSHAHKRIKQKITKDYKELCEKL